MALAACNGDFSCHTRVWGAAGPPLKIFANPLDMQSSRVLCAMLSANVSESAVVFSSVQASANTELTLAHTRTGSGELSSCCLIHASLFPSCSELGFHVLALWAKPPVAIQHMMYRSPHYTYHWIPCIVSSLQRWVQDFSSGG